VGSIVSEMSRVLHTSLDVQPFTSRIVITRRCALGRLLIAQRMTSIISSFSRSFSGIGPPGFNLREMAGFIYSMQSGRVSYA